MKKIMLSLLLLAAIGVKSMAQSPTPVYTTSVPVYTSTTEPVLISVPVYTERSFKMKYPTANRTTWYRLSDDWWRVAYVDNGPWYTLGYDTRGDSYPISLPVLQNAIPTNVVDAVLTRFSSVYDITETIGSGFQTQYIVRTLQADGQVKNHRVNAGGVDVPM